MDEVRTDKFVEAVRIKKGMKSSNPDSYCCLIKVPFRKRHPDFPIWFSLISLLFLELEPVVDSGIRYILQIMQRWK